MPCQLCQVRPVHTHTSCTCSICSVLRQQLAAPQPASSPHCQHSHVLVHTLCLSRARASACTATCASMTVVSSDQATFLVMGAVGSSHDATTLPNLPTPVAGADSSVARLLAAGSSSGGGSGSSGNGALSWTSDDGHPPPSDWVQLATAGAATRLSAARLRPSAACRSTAACLGSLPRAALSPCLPRAACLWLQASAFCTRCRSARAPSCCWACSTWASRRSPA